MTLWGVLKNSIQERHKVCKIILAIVEREWLSHVKKLILELKPNEEN